MPIIEADHVTKEFRLGQLHGLKRTLGRALARLQGRPIAAKAAFKALDDVHFSVEKGEVLGLIGDNGAGKSTLLKLLAGITAPTHGKVAVRGRVAPLIEVGAGLVPDLTGRENIFLNGIILGMKRAEIAQRFDDIVAFAEIEEFLDTPIKRYSSGMAVRLGFAIATSVNSEILIIDEVLAVGDLAFQRKCFDRLEDIIKRQGRTVLIVSHNIRQIERMCSRVILLHHGRVLEDGPGPGVCDVFLKRSAQRIHETVAKTSKGIIRTSGEAELRSIQTVDAKGNSITEVRTGASLHVRICFDLKVPLVQPEFIVGTHTTDFVYLTGSSTAVYEDRPDFDAGIHEIEFRLPSLPLAPGVYSLRFAILDRTRRLLFNGDSLHNFLVTIEVNEAREEGLRILNLPSQWVLNGVQFPRPTLLQNPPIVVGRNR
jgi:ABC-type polysaccharide/polyol phosphate transport system ATPase subunit